MVRKTNTKAPTKRKAKVKKDKESDIVFNCTSCAQPQLLVQDKHNILRHPQLQVGVCRECLIFAHADVTPLDNEGYEIYCRWCSELGKLVCCDECKTPFCEECISRNIGPEYYDSLMDVDEWKCVICEPTAIESLRELTKAVLDHQNCNEPSDLLLEKCSAIFNGDADINDSDREDIVMERLRLRRNDLDEIETLNRKRKEKAAAANTEKGSEEFDEYVSEQDEPDKGIKEIANKRKNFDSGSEYESSPESPKKTKDSMQPKKTKDSDEDSMPPKKTKDSDEDSMQPEEAKDSDEESLPSVSVSDKGSDKQKKPSDSKSAASNETLDLEIPSEKRARPRKAHDFFTRFYMKPKPAETQKPSDSKSTASNETLDLEKPSKKRGSSTDTSSKSKGLRNPTKKPKYVSSADEYISSEGHSDSM